MQFYHSSSRQVLAQTIISPRQMDILEVARNEGRVDVETLATHFSVTPQTIRKDLNSLCKAEKLHRVHGGAMLPSSTINLAYLSRRTIAAEGKRRIAEVVKTLIPDNASVILNIGTTTEQVACALRHHRELLVITNNLNVAMILSEAPGVELVIAGGMVRKTDGGIVGAAAVDLIGQFKVDYAVIGTSVIDEEGALLDFDYREVRVAKAILTQARKSILVADATKFSRRAPVQIGHIADIDIFVTDRHPPEGITELCAQSGARLIVAENNAKTNSPKAQGGVEHTSAYTKAQGEALITGELNTGKSREHYVSRTQDI